MEFFDRAYLSDTGTLSHELSSTIVDGWCWNCHSERSHEAEGRNLELHDDESGLIILSGCWNECW